MWGLGDIFGQTQKTEKRVGGAGGIFCDGVGSSVDGGQEVHGGNAVEMGNCRHIPTELVPDMVVDQVAVGRAHVTLLDGDGDVWCWGGGEQGQIGHGQRAASTKPRLVLADNDIVRITAGRYHNMAVTAFGAIFTWGSGESGQLGQGTEDTAARDDEHGVDSTLPAVVSTLLHHVCDLPSAGENHSIVLSSGVSSDRVGTARMRWYNLLQVELQLKRQSASRQRRGISTRQQRNIAHMMRTTWRDMLELEEEGEDMIDEGREHEHEHQHQHATDEANIDISEKPDTLSFPVESPALVEREHGCQESPQCRRSAELAGRVKREEEQELEQEQGQGQGQRQQRRQQQADCEAGTGDELAHTDAELVILRAQVTRYYSETFRGVEAAGTERMGSRLGSRTGPEPEAQLGAPCPPRSPRGTGRPVRAHTRPRSSTSRPQQPPHPPARQAVPQPNSMKRQGSRRPFSARVTRGDGGIDSRAAVTTAARRAARSRRQSDALNVGLAKPSPPRTMELRTRERAVKQRAINRNGRMTELLMDRHAKLSPRFGFFKDTARLLHMQQRATARSVIHPEVVQRLAAHVERLRRQYDECRSNAAQRNKRLVALRVSSDTVTQHANDTGIALADVRRMEVPAHPSPQHPSDILAAGHPSDHSCQVASLIPTLRSARCCVLRWARNQDRHVI